MSGTSLDGLDLALCSFEEAGGKYQFKLHQAETIPYENSLKIKLFNAFKANGADLMCLHHEFGVYLGKQADFFLKKHHLKAHAIASHGHTIFHQPKAGFSTQLGHGASIAATAEISTICDFRSLDIGLGGQGAPLVPIGDALLFGEYEACLNLGGIANISFNSLNIGRKAYDICICNMALNYLAEQKGLSFDDSGLLARSGNMNESLFNQLNDFSFFSDQEAKSLGYEWFKQNMLDLLNKQCIEDELRTVAEHIAFQIATVLSQNNIKKVLVTGGGAYNTFLLERIQILANCTIVLPEKSIIDFKEAIIFAFLGYLRLQNKINTLKSVTGAKNNSIGGAVYLI
jgi:anhydro-N-acetylmuramic acid kinase